MNYFGIDTFEKLKVALDNDFRSVELKLIGPDHICVDSLSNDLRFEDYGGIYLTEVTTRYSICAIFHPLHFNLYSMNRSQVNAQIKDIIREVELRKKLFLKGGMMIAPSNNFQLEGS